RPSGEGRLPFLPGRTTRPSGKSQDRPGSRSHLDLDQPARLNPEVRPGGYDRGGVLFRDDGRPLFLESDGERAPVEHGNVGPSVIEEHPTMTDPWRDDRRGRWNGDKARPTDAEPDWD